MLLLVAAAVALWLPCAIVALDVAAAAGLLLVCRCSRCWCRAVAAVLPYTLFPASKNKIHLWQAAQLPPVDDTDVVWKSGLKVLHGCRLQKMKKIMEHCSHVVTNNCTSNNVTLHSIISSHQHAVLQTCT